MERQELHIIDHARDLLDRGKAARLAGDISTAVESFLAAARFGIPTAKESFVAALNEVKTLAESGDADMQAKYGEMALESGYDVAGAIRNLKSSVESGNVLAKRVLGFALVSGAGVDRNPVRAAEFFKEAADAGDHYGEFNLSMLYQAGNGVPPDEAMSIGLLRSAAEGGLPVAMAVLGDRLGALNRDDEALKWHLRAAEAGLYQAMLTTARWYRDGFGTAVDNVQALRWFLAVQNAGRKDSMPEALALSKIMSDDQVQESARLAQREPDGELLIQMRSSHS